MDGEGEKAAQRGQAGGVGGVQGHPAGRTSKRDTFCTFPGTCTDTLMRLGEGTESPAHSFHANRTGRHHHRVHLAAQRARSVLELDCELELEPELED